MGAAKSRMARFQMSKPKLNLFLDLALALGVVLVLEEHFTGLNLHELIGVGLGLGLLVHLALHWRWIVSITRTFFHKLLHESRFNYMLNLVLFVDLAVVIVTGIGISRTLGLELGLSRTVVQSFESLHVQASNFSLLLVALHVAVHWKWIINHTQRYIFSIPAALLRKRFVRLPAPEAAPVPAATVSQHITGGVS